MRYKASYYTSTELNPILTKLHLISPPFVADCWCWLQPVQQNQATAKQGVSLCVAFNGLFLYRKDDLHWRAQEEIGRVLFGHSLHAGHEKRAQSAT